MSEHDFTPEQKVAVLDLLIIGMYADHKLTSAEDDRIQKMIDTFSFPSDYERQMFTDAAITRASREAVSPEAIRACVNKLAAHFPTPEVRRKAYHMLNNVITADGQVSAEESQLLTATREAFQL
jgi:uncharacterized tellurite resistance protein B-like protein